MHTVSCVIGGLTFAFAKAKEKLCHSFDQGKNKAKTPKHLTIDIENRKHQKRPCNQKRWNGGSSDQAFEPSQLRTFQLLNM